MDAAELTPLRRNLWLLAAQFAAFGAFIAAGSITFGLPVWLLLRLEASQLAILCVAYGLSSMLPLAFALKRVEFSAWLTIFITAAFFAASWYGSGFVFTRIPPNHTVVLCLVAVGLNLLLLRVGHPERPERLRISTLALAGFCAVSALLGILPLRQTALAEAVFRNLQKPVTREVETALHNVRVNFFRARIPASESQGGGLTVVGDQLLLLTGDGLFYLLNFSADSDRLDVQPLHRQVPVNRLEFRDSPLGPEQIENFRALAVLLPHTPSASILDSASAAPQTVLVSHHYWYADKSCFVVRVSGLHLPWPEFLTGSEPSGWETLFETSPCLPLRPGMDDLFAGNQSGGQMIQTGPNTILLTVGDHGHDGIFANPVAAQDPQGSYGKIIEIDINSGASRVYSLGHRNPQGLYQDRQGRIWETEHGPKGGDELNRIREGSNYGWPQATLGAKYYHFSWPGLRNPEPGTELVTPLFAWTPSIAVTALTQIEGGDFSRWQGDLMATSLVARSLIRIHFERGRPIMAEPIPLDERLRHIVRDSRGRLVFWTDRGDVGVLKRAPETPEDPK